jgi:hypothetical protein
MTLEGRKEVAVTYCKVVYHYIPEKTKESQKYFRIISL